MCEQDLTHEEELEAQRVVDIVLELAREDLVRMAGMLSRKKNSEIFGQTEFDIRDVVHRLGATFLKTALEERKKRGTEVPR